MSNKTFNTGGGAAFNIVTRCVKQRHHRIHVPVSLRTGRTSAQTRGHEAIRQTRGLPQRPQNHLHAVPRSARLKTRIQDSADAREHVYFAFRQPRRRVLILSGALLWWGATPRCWQHQIRQHLHRAPGTTPHHLRLTQPPIQATQRHRIRTTNRAKNQFLQLRRIQRMCQRPHAQHHGRNNALLRQHHIRRIKMNRYSSQQQCPAHPSKLTHRTYNHRNVRPRHPMQQVRAPHTIGHHQGMLRSRGGHHN